MTVIESAQKSPVLYLLHTSDADLQDLMGVYTSFERAQQMLFHHKERLEKSAYRWENFGIVGSSKDIDPNEPMTWACYEFDQCGEHKGFIIEEYPIDTGWERACVTSRAYGMTYPKF